MNKPPGPDLNMNYRNNRRPYNSPLNFGIRSFIRTLIICVGIIFIWAGTTQAWIINKTWEEFSAGATGSDADFTQSTGGSVSSSYAHGGKKSYKVTVVSGNPNDGTHTVTFPTRITENQEVWMRAYVFAPPGFNSTSNPVSKLLRMPTLDSNGVGVVGKKPSSSYPYISAFWGLPSNMECNSLTPAWPPGYGNPADIHGYLIGEGGYFFEYFTVYPYSTQSMCQNRTVTASNYLLTNQWQSVEIYAKAGSSNNGAMRMWHNGELIWEFTNVNTIPVGGSIGTATGGWPTPHLLGYWNGGAPATQDIYFDDLMITNMTPTQTDTFANPMIGMSENQGTDTTAPTAPSNLRVLP